MTRPPLFSVIVVDYEDAVPRDSLRRKMASLAAQTCPDFEVLVLHDGPKRSPYSDDLAGMPLPPATRFIVTDWRANDWGHSNRDRGIREARGTWIVHSNADNLFYPNLIERLKDAAENPLPAYRARESATGLRRSLGKRIARLMGRRYVSGRLEPAPEKEILIYAILMRGMVAAGKGIRRLPEPSGQALLFGGIPVKKGQIDVMQFVMRRDLWIKEGGWHDRSEEADGNMYPALARKYAVFAVPEVLGEHW